MAMKCPKCRKAIDYEAVEHDCGWRVSQAVVEVVTEPAASRDVAEAHLARMAAILHAPRAAPVEAEALVKLRAQVPMLKDVGHGTACTCEVCWRARQPARTEIVPDPVAAQQDEESSAQELAARYDALRAQYPPEEG